MKEVKRSKKFIVIIIVVIALLVLSTTSFVLISNNKTKEININEILETKEYSYLPKQAKNYIRQVYEETGEVLLTEENKEENMPYLNPKYVEYLSKTKEEQKKESVIPSNLVVDYVYGTTQSDTEDELPTKFDLRNVNGNNFVSPIKNQGKLDLCWAFATNAQAESYLLQRNITETFSERQVDYATSIDGIKNVNENVYSNILMTNTYRKLGGAGNFWIAARPMMDNLGLVNSSWKTYDDTDYEQMELHEIFNLANSNYEVNSTITFPILNISDLDLTNEDDIATRNSYIDMVKTVIKDNGGAYVGTQAPTYSCSVYDESLNSYVIYDDDNCTDANHAMQIIGWDDDVEYSFCASQPDGEKVSHTADLANCPSEDVITKKGAWILKNSWGTTNNPNEFPYDYSYVYLSYDSHNSDISLITEMEEKTWDNYYLESGEYYYTSNSKDFTKKIGQDEVLDKVKFMSLSTNAKYTVSIKVGNNEVVSKEVEALLPGVYTVDFVSENVTINEDFNVYINSNNTGYVHDSINVYTNNLDNAISIKTEDVSYSNSLSTTNTDYYELLVKSETKNIVDGSNVTYKLYDSSNADVSSKMSYRNNIVSMSAVLSTLVLDKNIGIGEYTLQTLYNDEVKCTSKININDELSKISGTGTVSDPYVITTPEELNMMKENIYASYILGNDIDLTEITSENGKYYNDGHGLSIDKFSGTLDGKGYSIIGLKNSGSYYGSNYLSTEFIRLYRDYESPSDVYIKNINFVNLNVDNLIEIYSDWTVYEDCSKGTISVENVAILGGEVKYNIFNLESFVFDSNTSVNINNIFNSADLEGSIIDYIRNYSKRNITISNIQNIGNIKNSVIEYSFVSNNEYFNISNILNTGKLKQLDVNTEKPASLTEVMDESGYEYSGTKSGTIKNAYHTNELEAIITKRCYEENYCLDYSEFVNTENVSRKTIKELTNSDLYTNWDNFDTNWKIETIDGISRIPVLKFVDFEYTTISDIELEIDETVNLYDLITPDIDLAKNITYEIKDNTIASIDEDGDIKGLKFGQTTIHVLSNYDGYEKDVLITVSNRPGYIIEFNSNEEEAKTVTQFFELEEEKKLTKNTFEREGYIFIGWDTLANGAGINYSDEEVVSKLSDTDGDKITLYAQWRPVIYQIEYIHNKGLGVLSYQTFQYDIPGYLTFDIEKEGYTLKEWNTEADGTGTSYVEGQEILNLTKEDRKIIRLFAIWTPIDYSVVFYSNDGMAKTLKQDLTYDVETSLSKNTFERTGYIFKEWNTMIDGSGTSYSDETKVKNLTSKEEEISLYAQWTPITYTIEFYGNGSVGIMDSQKFIYDVKDNFLSKNTLSKEGYTFKEWNTKADGTGTSYSDEASIFNISTINNDIIKLYAMWTANNYVVKFDSNTGVGIMENQTLTYDKESNLLENTFEKEGYTFAGWNTKADGTGVNYADKQNVVNLTSVNNEIITLYAMWTANNYVVKFDSNTGVGIMENQTLTYDKESNLIKNNYEKTGYIFSGWNTKADGTGVNYADKQNVVNLTSVNNEIITLYAKWTPITYEIKFDSNTGSGSMSNISLIYDDAQTLTLNTFEKEGYVFKYWNTKADGTGTKYSNGSEVINLTTKDKDIVTLYAIWRIDTLFEIEEYAIEDDFYINKILPNTSKDDYLEKIFVDTKYEVKVFNRDNTELSENEYVYTGSITKIMQGDTVIEEFTNIVLGDVNGDGSISISDVSKIHSHVEKTNIMKEDYYLKAADANRNIDITVSDTAKVFGYVQKVVTDLWR